MKVIIVGAGLSGLAAGYWLSKAGHQVTVFEATDRAGGRAKTIVRPGTSDHIDVGTQYFHDNYRLAKSLIRELGLYGSLEKVKGKTRFFDDRLKDGSFTTGHRLPYLAAGSVWQNLRMTIDGLFRMARHPFNPFSLDSERKIDRFSVGQKINDPFILEFNVRTLMSAGALVEPRYDEVSYHHLIRLMRIIVMTNYWVLKGGVTALHNALFEQLDVRLGEPVSGLLEEQERVVGVRLEHGDEVRADHTIVATSAGAARQILPRDWLFEQAYLETIEEPMALIVTLFLNTTLEKNIWSYVFQPDPERLVSFAIDTARKNPSSSPSGKTALQAWICAPRSETIMGLEDASILRLVIEELEKHFPDLSEIFEKGHVHRVSNAIPQMRPGHNQRAASFLQQMDQRHGIEIAGDHLTGGYMECALWSAKRAVQSISKDG